jgi:glucosylceramidase
MTKNIIIFFKSISFFWDRINWIFVVTLGLTLSLSGCDKSSEPEPETPPVPETIGKASVWITTGSQTKLLSKESDLSIIKKATTLSPVITINESQVLQEIDGFGAALTGSSAYLINKKMSAAQRNALLNDLFDPSIGIGITYLRVTMGASDFSLSDFTYDDITPGETDFDLENFTIENDEEDVIPVLQQITDISPDIKIMATPWSAPAWMKTNGDLKGGKLKTECYDVYADYFVKYIKAFGEAGITIDAITPQNEPLHFTAGYPCMEMQAADQASFIKSSLGPAFDAADLNTKIIVYDHNWDRADYPLTILNDAAVKSYIAGSAFHAYRGDVSAMSTVHNGHPDKGLYFTEISGGSWATNFSDNLQWNMSNIFIGTTKNWSKNALLWNLALDQNNGPQNNGCDNCRGVVTINSAGGDVTRNVEYYSIGHFSKFIRKGAHRIASSISSPVANLDFVAFMNESGERVIVISNNNDLAIPSITIRDGDAQFNYLIPSKSVVTITWKL